MARLAALASGLAAGVAHPPFGVVAGIVGYGLLMALLDVSGPNPRRSAFFRGWLAGVGYFAVSIWWIVEPFQVDAEAQGWMAPIALFLMAGGLALFWGCAGLVYRLISPQSVARVLVFAGLLAAFEWLRGHVLTGFPWDLPGESWGAGSAPSQMASVVGAYGLTWITLAIGAAPAVLFQRDARWDAKALAAALGLGALGCLYAFGMGRLEYAARVSPQAPVVRVVQANIDQKNKWRPDNLELIFATYLSMTRQPGAQVPQIVVWPEGALPAVIDDLLAPGAPYGRRLWDALTDDQTLLLGANRAARDASGETVYFNSLVALRHEGGGLRVTGLYDKHRLVPFGEFLPLGALATKLGVRSLVHMPDDFTAGPPPRPITPWGIPALQPLICYEALFPGFTRAAAARSGGRPAWILNVSNDAWFGATSGPLQHLNIASYRAIEEGLPIVRATPTGVSAVIDAYGRVAPEATLVMGAVGVLDAHLPPALGPTVYSRLGDLLFGGLLLLSLLAAAVDRVRRPRLDDAGFNYSVHRKP